MTELINLHYPLKDFNRPQQEQVIAMGFFDGVHLGHQKVISEAAMIAKEKGLPLAVLTYNPYPGLVFEKMANPFHYLTPLNQKVELLQQLGVTTVYCLQLTSHVAELAPEQFIQEILLPLRAKTVVAGFDHRYGSDKYQADMPHLKGFAKGRFEVRTVSQLSQSDDHQKIASRTIRKELENGDLIHVNEQLGRIHETTGLIVHGDARGRTLGFPTINIWTPELEFVPGIGVYVVETFVNGAWYQGMASIGRNVTFEANRPVTVEINLFDFSDQVYGENVRIKWHVKLRGEVKFTTVDALVDQLHEDQKQTKEYFIKRG